jgi:hypothetical protein
MIVNNLHIERAGLRNIFLAAVVLLLSACGGSDDAEVPQTGDAALLNVSSSGTTSVNYNLWDLIDTLPYEFLSDAELEALSLMREEEKLARDVYLYLYAAWDVPIFLNISDAEQTHTDAVLRLIQKYDLPDPAQDGLPGVFSDPVLQGLYDVLTAQGTTSLIDAYFVGATIEDLDIYDIKRLLLEIDNQDIIVVFENLERVRLNYQQRDGDRSIGDRPGRHIAQDNLSNRLFKRNQKNETSHTFTANCSIVAGRSCHSIGTRRAAGNGQRFQHASLFRLRPER